MSEENNVTATEAGVDANAVAADSDDWDAQPFDDDEFGPASEPTRLPRVTAVLAIVLFVVVGFVAGALVERNFGTDSAGNDVFPVIGSGQLPDFGGAVPGDSPTSGTDSAGSGRARVIGTVVSAYRDEVTVEDFGGTTHVFVVTDNTRIDSDVAKSGSDVTQGATVTVTARERPNGSYTATSITAS